MTDGIFIIAVAICVILFAGEPDFADKIVANTFNESCELSED